MFFTRAVVMVAVLQGAVHAHAQEPLNAELTAVAAQLVRQAGLPYDVRVLVPASWRAAGIVNASTNRTAFVDVIIVRVSPILIEELGSPSLRALLAHELAHLENPCGPKYGNAREALQCEHEADALSARWVGRTAVLRTLCEVMTISFEWRYRTDASISIERIKLLHDRTDIPREVQVP